VIPHLITGLPAGAPVSTNTGIVLPQIIAAASSPRVVPAAVIAGASDNSMTAIEVSDRKTDGYQNPVQAGVLEVQRPIPLTTSLTESIAVSNCLGAASDIDSVNQSNGTTYRDRSQPQTDDDLLGAILYDLRRHA
jgi:hypothetical protein